jgi:hypothetical protein
MAAMSRLSTAFLGAAVACALAVPSLPAQAASHDGGSLLAKAKKKKAGKKKPARKPKQAATPEIEKGMKVVTMTDTTVVKTPEEGAKKVFAASEGQVLTVVKVQKKWVQVKNSDGKQGWVQAAEVVPKEVYDAKAEDEGGGGDEGEGGGDEGEGGGRDEGETAKTDEGGGGDEGEGSSVGSEDEDGKKKKKKRSDDEEGEDGGGGTEVTGRASLNGKLRIAAGARVIGLIRSQEFASKGTNAYSNYTINVSSPGADVFARVTRKGGSLELGAEVGFLATFGNGGVTVGSGATAETLAWSETRIDARLLVGYHVADGYLLSARVGYRLQTINIDESDAIFQPSEQLGGVAVGAEALMYGFSPKFELRIGAETLVAAALTQTETLKDGDDSTVSPIYVLVEAAYLVTPKLQIVGRYDLGYESYAFTGDSQRGDMTNDNGTRTDLQHTFSIGAQYWF